MFTIIDKDNGDLIIMVQSQIVQHNFVKGKGTRAFHPIISKAIY